MLGGAYWEGVVAPRLDPDVFGVVMDYRLVLMFIKHFGGLPRYSICSDVGVSFERLVKPWQVDIPVG